LRDVVSEACIGFPPAFLTPQLRREYRGLIGATAASIASFLTPVNIEYGPKCRRSAAKVY